MRFIFTGITLGLITVSAVVALCVRYGIDRVYESTVALYELTGRHLFKICFAIWLLESLLVGGLVISESGNFFAAAVGVVFLGLLWALTYLVLKLVLDYAIKKLKDLEEHS